MKFWPQKPASYSPESGYGSRSGRGLYKQGESSTGGPPDGYWELAPDLTVEVVSPNDTAAEVQGKVGTWLEAGGRLVWVVYPKTRSVVVHKSLKDISTLTEGESLTGEEILPGFECVVRSIFE